MSHTVIRTGTRTGTGTVPGGILALRDTPLVRGRLLFSVVPDERRLRVIGSDLAGAVEVRSHHDSSSPDGGLVLVHSYHPLFDGHDPIPCDLTGTCHPWLDRRSYRSRFAAAIAADDLDTVIAELTRLHDRTLA